MFRLIVVFLLVQCAILARFLVYEAFDPLYYAFTYLFLIAAVVLYVISKRTTKKELAFVPTNITGWSFFDRQKIFTIPKPLYKGGEKRGYIQRYFMKKWQYIVADLISLSFFLALKIEIDGQLYDLKPDKGKWFSNQSYWTIYKNGEMIGSAQTKVDLKNTVKLTEVIEFTYAEESFTTSATTVTSAITLFKNDQPIGKMKRNHIISNVNVIEAAENDPKKIIALVLHTYHFKNA